MHNSSKLRVKVAGVALTCLLAGAGTAAAISTTSVFGFAKHGADDPAGDDRGGLRGGHGADDPVGHG